MGGGRFCAVCADVRSHARRRATRERATRERATRAGDTLCELFDNHCSSAEGWYNAYTAGTRNTRKHLVFASTSRVRARTVGSMGPDAPSASLLRGVHQARSRKQASRARRQGLRKLDAQLGTRGVGVAGGLFLGERVAQALLQLLELDDLGGGQVLLPRLNDTLVGEH